MENKSQSDSSDSDASVGCCGNCGETDVNVEFCYGCKEDYCEHCGVADIMTDCGDAVIDEMNWYKEKAHEICKGKATFDMESQ